MRSTQGGRALCPSLCALLIGVRSQKCIIVLLVIALLAVIIVPIVLTQVLRNA